MLGRITKRHTDGEEREILTLPFTFPILNERIPGGVLGISSDGDDRMEPKVKTQKNPQGFQRNPKKSLDQKLTPPKIPCRFCGP